MQVTARGVETADQQLFLRAVGVHSMQGFRFGRPVTVAEISARLQSPARARQLGQSRHPSCTRDDGVRARFYDMRASPSSVQVQS